MVRAFVAVLWICLAAMWLAFGSVDGTIRVGSLTLTRCMPQYDGYCGSLVRPLDPEGHVAGKITIGFEYYPRTDSAHPRRGAILAQEGGPGYSTTGSRDGYVRLFAPLRDGRDIVLIDKRGTGRSGAIDCQDIKKDAGLDAIRTCGRKLGPASWLYGSTFAADDVAAVLAALDVGKVDYYGDSYGTFFGQVLAARHPDLLRTLVLDSAYPVIGGSPYFETEIENGPASFAIVCSRSPSCRALGGDAKARFNALVEALRKTPFAGRAPGTSGEIRNVTADAGALFTIVANAGNNFTAYRDIDAAGRAWLEARDSLPLLRLVAEASDGEDISGSSSDFSTGLQFAVQCADYVQLYDMRDSEPARHAQYIAAIAGLVSNSPQIYTPFRVEDSFHAVGNPEALNLCQAWPQAPDWAQPGMPVSGNTKFPAIPVLVLAGEFDTITSPKEARWTAALFPHATYLEVPNAIHEAAIGNGGNHVPPFGGDLARCTGTIVLGFVETGGRLPNASCLSEIRPVRPVPAFAASWRNLAPAAAQDGNEVDQNRLRLASAAAETIGDAVARYGVMPDNVGAGLRGGRFTLSETQTGYAFNLDGLKWTDDLIVSGTIAWNQLTGQIIARVNLSAQDHAGQVTISWNDREKDAEAAIGGEIDGRIVVASRIAP